jgi:tRNA nucleotidyltransferase/poly(A) polymerase
MIFKFWELKILKKHFHFLKSKINTSDFFLVGWSIRDILLWLTTSPEDIDFTMSWNPIELYESINKELKKNNKGNLNLNESSVTANGTKVLNEEKVYKSPDLLKTIDFMNRVLSC